MLGSWVLYHDPLYGFHNQYGIVIWQSNTSIGISIPKFKGDYLSIPISDLNTNTEHKQILLNYPLSKEKKLLTLSTFDNWWYKKHNDIFSYFVIKELA